MDDRRRPRNRDGPVAIAPAAATGLAAPCAARPGPHDRRPSRVRRPTAARLPPRSVSSDKLMLSRARPLDSLTDKPTLTSSKLGVQICEDGEYAAVIVGGAWEVELGEDAGHVLLA